MSVASASDDAHAIQGLLRHASEESCGVIFEVHVNFCLEAAAVSDRQAHTRQRMFFHRVQPFARHENAVEVVPIQNESGSTGSPSRPRLPRVDVLHDYVLLST